MHGEDTPTTLLPPPEELFKDDLEPQPETVQSAPGNQDNIPLMGPPPAPTPAPVPPTRLPRELCNLQSDLAPHLLEPGNRPTGRERMNLMLDDYDLIKNSLPDFAFITALVSETIHECYENNEDNKDKATVDEPKTFQEAWNNPNQDHQLKWREAIKKELRDMINRRVFQKVKRSSMPTGKRCVKNKWVFKVKRNGIFRAQLVACGYSQIPGVDFQEHFAPVVNDTSYRIMIAIMIMMGLKAKIVDIETAFLHGDLEEEIYMDAPEGIGATEDEVVKLEQMIYGFIYGPDDLIFLF